MASTNSIAREFGDFFVFALFHGCWCFHTRPSMVRFLRFTFYALLGSSEKMLDVL